MSKVSRGLADNVIRPEQEQTINEVFTAVGRLTPESFRVNRLPLLNLPDGILEALRAGQIEYTKAKAIAQIKDEQARVELLVGAIEQGLSLTDIKERVKALREPSSTQEAPGAEYIRKRVNQLGKLSKNSAALDDQTTRQKLDKLIAQIEKLLKG
jgi:ParB family chromosome partitioning protein